MGVGPIKTSAEAVANSNTVDGSTLVAGNTQVDGKTSAEAVANNSTVDGSALVVGNTQVDGDTQVETPVVIAPGAISHNQPMHHDLPTLAMLKNAMSDLRYSEKKPNFGK